jgi:lipopolysaccharide/colanic/teichoic acid biosynthesis glycosyltransferase
MTAEARAYPPVASAPIPSKARYLRRTLAGRLRLGPCLVACDITTFGLVGLIGRAVPLVGAVTLAAIIATYHAGRLYRPRLTLSLLDDVPALVGRALAATAAVLVAFQLVGSDLDATRMVFVATTAIALLMLTRGASYAVIREARRRRLVAHRAVVHGLVGRTVKRSIDVIIAAVALLAAAPLMAACALAVRLGSDGPVLFRQRRLGVGLRSFVMIKFRTLRSADAAPGPVGRFLRKYSLDELPQLFNVLRGDMSLVGPRPELPIFVDEFSGRYPGYRDRHRVKAGLTGWSQIHGLRGECSIEDRARFDNQYIENWSIWGDVKILLRTLTALLHHRGT